MFDLCLHVHKAWRSTRDNRTNFSTVAWNRQTLLTEIEEARRGANRFRYAKIASISSRTQRGKSKGKITPSSTFPNIAFRRFFNAHLRFINSRPGARNGVFAASRRVPLFYATWRFRGTLLFPRSLGKSSRIRWPVAPNMFTRAVKIALFLAPKRACASAWKIRSTNTR